MIQSKENKTLFSLLRYALWQNRDGEQINFDLTTQEWQLLIDCAARHGVLAIAFDALPKGVVIPSLTKELLIRWELSVQRMEDRNKRQREALKELVNLFRDSGIEILLLKGLGLSENYPRPGHRECGDLDIYLFGEYEKGNQVIEKLGIKVFREGTKHSTFFIKGIPVENHLSFLDVDFTQTDKNLEVHLNRILKGQGYNTIRIDDVEVRIPTPDFTAIFLTRHDIGHFLPSGLVLRHFCDFALFFSRNTDQISFKLFMEILAEESQLNLFCSFIDLAHKYLGMPISTMPVLTKNDKISDLVFMDTMNYRFRRRGIEELKKMWLPKRKIIGAINLVKSKWKYDLVGHGAFYQRLKFSLKNGF
jgi:hypothetical protein